MPLANNESGTVAGSSGTKVGSSARSPSLLASSLPQSVGTSVGAPDTGDSGELAPSLLP